MLGAAAFVTAALLAVALYMGDWAYGTRSSSLHERRLTRMLEEKPHRDALSHALRDEGMIEVASAKAPSELAEVARRWGGTKRDEVLAKGGRWPLTLVFSGNGMVYLLYFDEKGQVRDYTFVAA
jgi:hypothetical protein